MNRNKEQVDHKAEALRQLGRVGGLSDLTVSELAPIATVHALLAMAEGQERVAEALIGLQSEINDLRQDLDTEISALREAVAK